MARNGNIPVGVLHKVSQLKLLNQYESMVYTLSPRQGYSDDNMTVSDIELLVPLISSRLLPDSTNQRLVSAEGHARSTACCA